MFLHKQTACQICGHLQSYLWAIIKPREHALLSILSLYSLAFTTPPSDVVVALGSSARFDCVFTTASSVSVSWEKDGVFITPVERFSYLVNNSLLISSTAAGDNGTYTCIVTDQTTLQRVERSAILNFACKKAVLYSLSSPALQYLLDLHRPISFFPVTRFS